MILVPKNGWINTFPIHCMCKKYIDNIDSMLVLRRCELNFCIPVFQITFMIRWKMTNVPCEIVHIQYKCIKMICQNWTKLYHTRWDLLAIRCHLKKNIFYLISTCQNCDCQKYFRNASFCILCENVWEHSHDE